MKRKEIKLEHKRGITYTQNATIQWKLIVNNSANSPFNNLNNKQYKSLNKKFKRKYEAIPWHIWEILTQWSLSKNVYIYNMWENAIISAKFEYDKLCVEKLRIKGLYEKANEQLSRLPTYFKWTKETNPWEDLIYKQEVQIHALGQYNSADIKRSLDKVEMDLEELQQRMDLWINKFTKLNSIIKFVITEKENVQTREIENLRKALLFGSINILYFNNTKKEILKVLIQNKEMQNLQQKNINNAKLKIRGYIDAGILQFGYFNQYYCSPYDKDEDCFGASAPINATYNISNIQWLNSWEFHIHAKLIRDNNGRITNFMIKSGHIKPKTKKMKTGYSIEIDKDILNKIESYNLDKIKRWGNSKIAKNILVKQ